MSEAVTTCGRGVRFHDGDVGRQQNPSFGLVFNEPIEIDCTTPRRTSGSETVEPDQGTHDKMPKSSNGIAV